MTSDAPVRPDLTNHAERFVRARETRRSIPLLHPETTLTTEEAYAVQHAFAERWCARQATTARGYKVSVTNAPAQASIDTDEPTYGTLFRESVLASGDTLRLEDAFTPMLVEAELIFLVDRDLAPDADRDEILASTRVAAGLELPESRYRDWWPDPQLRVMDLVADNSVAGRVVVGDAVEARGLDTTAIAMRTTLDGREILTGDSSAVLGDPVESVRWLLGKLASQGRRLRRGELVSSGTFTAPLPLERGTYEATYAGVGRVSVTLA